MAKEIIRRKFGIGLREKTPPTESEQPLKPSDPHRAFGSGFIITENGYLLTNAHVIAGAKSIAVRVESGTFNATVIVADKQNDVALLKIDGKHTPVVFSAGSSARLGQTVFVVGFPLPSIQGFTPKVTKGVISGTRGIRDDIRSYQIDAAVQPGNSGGPLADEHGNVIGVVVAKLNDLGLLLATGSVPQNVNYAVKKSYALALVENHPEAAKNIRSAATSDKLTFEEAVERIRKSVVLITVCK